MISFFSFFSVSIHAIALFHSLSRSQYYSSSSYVLFNCSIFEILQKILIIKKFTWRGRIRRRFSTDAEQKAVRVSVALLSNAPTTTTTTRTTRQSGTSKRRATTTCWPSHTLSLSYTFLGSRQMLSFGCFLVVFD